MENTSCFLCRIKSSDLPKGVEEPNFKCAFSQSHTRVAPFTKNKTKKLSSTELAGKLRLQLRTDFCQMVRSLCSSLSNSQILMSLNLEMKHKKWTAFASINSFKKNPSLQTVAEQEDKIAQRKKKTLFVSSDLFLFKAIYQLQVLFFFHFFSQNPCETEHFIQHTT